MSTDLPKASRQQPIRPEPQETPEEQFDELIETVKEELDMKYNALNTLNALNELKEILEKRDTQLKEKEAELNDRIQKFNKKVEEGTAEVVKLNEMIDKDLKRREEELKQKEEELKKSNEANNKNIELSLQREYELNRRQTELIQKEMKLNTLEAEIEKFLEISPTIFKEVPPESDMNQSYPIIQKLNDLGKGAVYTAARKIIIQILKKLRELCYMTIDNIEVKWACAACFYRVQFPAVTLQDIIDALKDFVKELSEIHNEELNYIISELELKVIDKLETT